MLLSRIGPAENGKNMCRFRTNVAKPAHDSRRHGKYVERLQHHFLLTFHFRSLAQNNLGSMYSEGDGVPENDVEALKWYSLAKAQGNEVAADNLKLIQKIMSHTQIAKAQALAAEWWEKHNN